LSTKYQSLPVWPIIVSAPVPPSSTSLPARLASTSLPPPPRNVFAPSLP